MLWCHVACHSKWPLTMTNGSLKSRIFSNNSLIYSHIYIYRLVLNILFLGKYRQRFNAIISLINPEKEKKVVELCFGDIYVARWCKTNGIDYTGFDINQHFINNAKRQGYCVEFMNLRNASLIPHSDVVVMMGALYHFHDIIDELINNIMKSSPRFIISEPISNLAQRKGLLGYIAMKSTRVGNNDETFRFNANSLSEALEKISNGRWRISSRLLGKEMIVDIRRN